MKRSQIYAGLLVPFYLSIGPSLYGQAPGAAARPEPDVLIFTNGEKLIGHLEKSTGDTVTFKSEMAGTVTTEWSKIQELRSSQKFAAIPTSVKTMKKADAAAIPVGTVEMTGQKVVIGGETAKALPVASVSNVVNEADFERALHRSGFTEGWVGGATAGLSLARATQNSQTYTAALNLVRAVPAVSWLTQRSRTIFDLNEAYGSVSQPGTATVKTSIFHADLEQDWYLSSRTFLFASGVWDHSYSQGLDLQQNYGGGLGFVVFKTDRHELDFKASMNYINQTFSNGKSNSLIGSSFGETYVRKFAHGITLNEQGGFTPAWNNTQAYSAFASAGLTFPVYHRIGFTLGAVDNFLNDPPPGFKKNSFQLTVGATYAIK